MKGFVGALGLLMVFGLHAETWRFALIGDVPYSDYERGELPSMIDSISAEHLDFIVHTGDFKRSDEKCSDEILLDRHSLFNASRLPFIYVPGDNEWIDCTLPVAGHYAELERLGKLREIFFSEPLSLGKATIPVEQQSAAFPEHLRWRLGPVLFVSLNVPGPNNNFGLSKEPGDEYQLRNPLVIDWLKRGFAQARRENSAGIVIVMQGNPGFKHFAAGFAHNGYRQLLDVLRSETLDFPGQVLLMHGDTHWHRVDHPLRHPDTKERIANFTRVESFGYPVMGWVKVIIDSGSPTLFRFEARPYKSN